MENPRHRIRRRLQRAAREQLDTRRQAFVELRRAVEPLEARAEALATLLDALERRFGELRVDLEARDAPFSPDMSINRVLRRHRGAAGILARHHLPACGGCAVRFDESLEEACMAYGLDLDSLLDQLNRLLTST